MKITPKKKTVRISFDREEVEKPKKKDKSENKKKHYAKDEDTETANGGSTTASLTSPVLKLRRAKRSHVR